MPKRIEARQASIEEKIGLSENTFPSLRAGESEGEYFTRLAKMGVLTLPDFLAHCVIFPRPAKNFSLRDLVEQSIAKEKLRNNGIASRR